MDRFVGATAPIPITHLKEDMISVMDNLKYSIESVQTVLDSVPQGSQFHKSTSRGPKLSHCSKGVVQ